MLLSEYYKDSKYSGNGENYEVLEAGKNQRSVFKLLCTICDDINFVTAASILSGRKPCLCSKKSFKTPEKMLVRLQKTIIDKPILLLDTSVESAKSPLRVQCQVCEDIWYSSYNSLVLKESGCPSCNGSRKLTEEELLSRLELVIAGKDVVLKKIHYDKGLSGKLQTDMYCSRCSTSWTTSVASVLRGAGCPVCAKCGFQKTKPAYLYILRIVSEHDILLGYKYGITCDLHRRITQHNKLNRPLGITFHTSFVWKYLTGEIAAGHEKNIKDVFGSYFNKEQLPSGFSETIDIYNLTELIDFQISQYRSYKCPNSD